METLAIANPQFSEAQLEDLDYIVDKTIELHEFETQSSQSSLTINQNFRTEITQWIKTEILNGDSLVFTIKMKEEKIGFALIKLLPTPNNFTNDSAYGLIQSIWIDEAHRKHNIGCRVVAFIESIFKEQGISYYEVSFEATNKVAQGFWEKCGLVAYSITARKFLD